MTIARTPCAAAASPAASDRRGMLLAGLSSSVPGRPGGSPRVPAVTMNGLPEPASVAVIASIARWSTRALAAKSVKSWMKAVWMTASAAAAPRCRLSRSASEPRCTAAPAAASERAPASERASPRT